MHLRTTAVLVLLAGCSGKSAPDPQPPVTPVTPVASIASADLSKITLDPAAGDWEGSVDGELRRYQLNTNEAFGKFMLEPWDVTWPSTAADFEARLTEPGFSGPGVRYQITEREVTPEAWVFRGVLVFDADAAQHRAFVVVRTIANARFLCTGWSQTNDADEVVTSIEGCRATRL
jgi:hypothetical protein